jgi:transcription elongation factor GreA
MKGIYPMADEIILTSAGLKELEDELEQLKTVGRKDIADKIKTALSFGDLSENSEYDEAKSEQGKLESRIAEIEAMLPNVKVLDEGELTNDTVHVGSKVRLKDGETGETVTYQIVGFTEADPDAGKISDESPVGKTLIGKKKGANVTVEVPSGKIKYKILEISKPESANTK